MGRVPKTCHSEGTEESCRLRQRNNSKIPHCVRNDKVALSQQGVQLLAVGLQNDTLFADDGVDELGRRDVKNRVERVVTGRSNHLATELGELTGAAFLDGNLGAAAAAKIEGAAGRHHHEFDAVPSGGNRQRIGTNLVGGVSVGSDAIGDRR